MAKHHLHHAHHAAGDTSPESDIATEQYRGPGKVITSAGYMYISHAAAMIAGLLGLGAVGAIFHTRTNAIKQWAEALSASHAESNGLKKGLASTIAWVSGIAEKAAHKIVGVGKKLAGNRLNGKSLGEDKTAAFLFSGGFGAVFGYVGSSIWGVLKGAHEGDRGKHQFERAQKEIKHLRTVNADLEKTHKQPQADTEQTTAPAQPETPAKPEHKSHPEHHDKAKPEHAEHGSPHEAKKEHAHTPEHASHHADKPQTHTHAHAHQGTVGQHTHEPAMA